MRNTIHQLIIVAVTLLVGCGDDIGGALGDTGPVPDGSTGPDSAIGPDSSTATTTCPTAPQQGDSCNVASAIVCPGMDYMAFSCGLQTCRCQGGAFDCTPFSPSDGDGCKPFKEGASCSFEGNPGCDLGQPVSGAVTCKNGQWIYWTACHSECPMAYSDSLPGTPCSFTPDEGACSWGNNYCTCRDGKFDCS